MDGVHLTGADRKNNEIEEENKGYVFHSNGIQEPQQIGAMRGTQPWNREGRENINPHESNDLELNEPARKSERLRGNVEKPKDETDMNEMSRRKAEAKIAAVPRHDGEGWSKQGCHPTARIGQPKEQQRQACCHTQRRDRALLSRPHDGKDGGG
ncbi:MAG TPA: hypothetical protein VL996_02315 [Methylocella sp.]|nr:hypothetical protein [Methylocella sp.]